MKIDRRPFRNFRMRFIHEFIFEFRFSDPRSLLCAFENAKKRDEVDLCDRARYYMTKNGSKIPWETGLIKVGFIQCMGFGIIGEKFSRKEICEMILASGYDLCTVQFFYELALQREKWLKIIPPSNIYEFNSFDAGMPTICACEAGAHYPQSLSVLSNPIPGSNSGQCPMLHMSDTSTDEKFSAYDVIAVSCYAG